MSQRVRPRNAARTATRPARHFPAGACERRDSPPLSGASVLLPQELASDHGILVLQSGDPPAAETFHVASLVITLLILPRPLIDVAIARKFW